MDSERALVVCDGRLSFGPLVMGVVNATPDSFSDGGRGVDESLALARSMAGLADVIDVGGESTRPGSAPVSLEDELARVLPIVSALAGSIVSVDTVKADVARAAVGAGARIVNDVSGGLFDAAMLDVVASLGCVVILGHVRGTRETMHAQPDYHDVVGEVRDELAARVSAARAAGIAAERIWIDPGLGFSKRTEHNLALLARLHELRMGHPIVVGASRKRFLGAIGGGDVQHREEATAAAHAIAIWNGADVVRVHDVARQAGAMRVARAIARTR